MDLSSLPQSQQHQIQQLYQQFQDYQGQQQPEQSQQHHDYTSQPQDPSQYQAYQPWTDPYYQQYHQNPQQPQPDFAQTNQQTQYPYYHHDYANAYQPHQQPAQTESGPIQPPRVLESQGAMIEANSRGTLGQGQVQIQHLQNAYYPQRQNVGHAPGLNPAAAAAVEALSQLTQFAGSMGAAERAMSGIQGNHLHGLGPGLFRGGPDALHPSVDHYLSYGGRRGGHPFQGSGRGFQTPPFYGRTVRGRGRGRRGGPPRNSAPRGTSKSSQPESSTAINAESSKGEDTIQSVPEKGTTMKVGCELCGVDCVTLEILEQHKNGKKHKKNLQKTEELKNGTQTVLSSDEATKTTEISLPENPSDGVRRGIKRKIWGGQRGEKQQRMEVAKPPKVVIPFMCDLCNVKCDTQEVLNCHLTGKKHNAKLKKFEDHGARFGPLGLQSLYPPNPMAHQQQPMVLTPSFAPPTFPPHMQQQHIAPLDASFQSQVHYNNITATAAGSELLNVGSTAAHEQQSVQGGGVGT